MSSDSLKRVGKVVLPIAEHSLYVAALEFVNTIPTKWQMLGHLLIAGCKTAKAQFQKSSVEKVEEVEMTPQMEMNASMAKSPVSPGYAPLSLDDRCEFLCDKINAMFAEKGIRYKRDSLLEMIKNVITKPEEALRQEAVKKLSPLERKALGL